MKISTGYKIILLFAILFFFKPVMADVAPTYSTQWGSSGTGNGQFSSIYGITTDSSGNVYVVDTGNNRIQKFDSGGTYVSQWGSSGSSNGLFSTPIDISKDSLGNFYVADQGNCRIQKFTSSGVYSSKWGICSGLPGAGHFVALRGINIDTSDNVYIADPSSFYYIKKTTTAGASLALFGGSHGSGDGEFNINYGLATDSSGNVYVVDSGNNRVQKLDSSGTYISQFGSSGSGNGQFNAPIGITIDSSGNIYVADTGNNRIQKFDSSGTYLTQWGSSGSGNGQFNAPYSLTTDSTNNVYVTDRNNNRVQKFSPTTPTISSITTSTGSTTATIQWTTDAASDSIITYGITSSYGASTTLDASLVTSHSQSITNLIPCTSYHFQVASKYTGSPTATSTDGTFVTGGCTGGASVLSISSTEITTSVGGTISLGNLTLIIPASFTGTSSSVVFQPKFIDATNFSATAGTPSGAGVLIGTNILNLRAISGTSTVISTFDLPLTLTLTYSPSEVSGIDTSTLKIYRYDGSTWTMLPNCSVDTAARSVTCNTSNFSEFAIFGSPLTSTNQVASGALAYSSGIVYGCKDLKALNYNAFSASDPSLCQYEKPINTVTFSRNLKFGMKGDDVKALQIFLNTHGFVLASVGFGSLGYETNYFGQLTLASVIKFQKANNIEPSVGYFGVITKAKINSIISNP